MRRHLVIFAKEPRLGAVKTRLAGDIGAIAALRFYEATLAQTLARLAGGPWQSWLALTPDRCVRDARRIWRTLPDAVRLVGQGQGGLGVRMQRIFTNFPPGPVVLVGSDIPAMHARHIEAAFAALGRHDVVFGPAEDGGYWLVGQRRLRPLPRLFADVRWSSSHALDDTLRNLPPHTRCAFVERLADIDDARAWRRAAAANRSCSAATAAGRAG